MDSAGATSEIKVVRVRVFGRVQGVWYRGWTERAATERGLSGWVRNRADGSVEALFAGPAAMVEAMVQDCHIGPPAARVTSVSTEPDQWSGGPSFVQRPTV